MRARCADEQHVGSAIVERSAQKGLQQLDGYAVAAS